jgi:NAD(P)-dependent dehydrogenase (short-subunit alcohol dehydrogenase family)
MAEEGAIVVAAARSIDLLHSLVGEIEAGGGRAEALELDVGDLDRYRQSVRDVADRHGRLDVFVHNAMCGLGGPVLELSLETWRANMLLNADACFVSNQEALRVMVPNRSGSIINIASIGALKVPIGHAAYGASKAALVHFSRCAALENAVHNVRVNVVAPGMIETDTMFASLPSKEAEQLARANVPMQRFGQPVELANAVVFLASDEASFITGEVMLVDGGRFPKM